MGIFSKFNIFGSKAEQIPEKANQDPLEKVTPIPLTPVQEVSGRATDFLRQQNENRTVLDSIQARRVNEVPDLLDDFDAPDFMAKIKNLDQFRQKNILNKLQTYQRTRTLILGLQNRIEAIKDPNSYENVRVQQLKNERDHLNSDLEATEGSGVKKGLFGAALSLFRGKSYRESRARILENEETSQNAQVRLQRLNEGINSWANLEGKKVELTEELNKIRAEILAEFEVVKDTYKTSDAFLREQLLARAEVKRPFKVVMEELKALSTKFASKLTLAFGSGDRRLLFEKYSANIRTGISEFVTIEVAKIVNEEAGNVSRSFLIETSLKSLVDQILSTTSSFRESVNNLDLQNTFSDSAVRELIKDAFRQYMRGLEKPAPWMIEVLTGVFRSIV